MRKLIFTLTLCYIISIINAQDAGSNVSLSKADEISKNSGSLFEKVYFELGKLNDVEVEFFTLKDLLSEVSAKYIVLTNTRKSYSGITSRDRASIDHDELLNLKKVITLLKEKSIEKPEHDTEFNFKTRSGFEIGTYWATTRWHGYMQLERHDSDSIVRFEMDVFDEFITLIDKALTY